MVEKNRFSNKRRIARTKMPKSRPLTTRLLRGNTRVGVTSSHPCDVEGFPFQERQTTSLALRFSKVKSTPFAGIKTLLGEIRNPPKQSPYKGLSGAERDEAAVMAVWDDFCGRGRILNDGHKSYFFVNETKTLIGIDDGIRFTDWLTFYGLLPGDSLTKKVTKTIAAWAIRRGGTGNSALGSTL